MKGEYNTRIKRISPEKQHYFYGYYDNNQISDDGRLYLFNNVDFMDRLPVPGDVCRLGYIDINTGKTTTFAETTSWNFQQGCMLEWDPIRKDTVYYNKYIDGDYRSIRHNIKTGAQVIFSRANADISPDGKYGLSINFNRIYDFRPGYGYCQFTDPYKDIVAPKEDGIFLTDLETGESRLLLSYEKLYGLFNTSPDTKDCKVVINHITFNAESNRFLFLIRCFPHNSDTWLTGLGTSDLNGNVYVLRNYTFASHYFWKENGYLLIFADCGEGPGLYELKDQTQEYKLFDKNFFDNDIHCTYSPDRKWIIGDGYPDETGYRTNYLFNIDKNIGKVLYRAYSPRIPGLEDIRCDFHGKWTKDGKTVVFDSIHEGFRGIYKIDISSDLDELK